MRGGGLELPSHRHGTAVEGAHARPHLEHSKTAEVVLKNGAYDRFWLICSGSRSAPSRSVCKGQGSSWGCTRARPSNEPPQVFRIGAI
jgi:hypothetical protein